MKWKRSYFQYETECKNLITQSKKGVIHLVVSLEANSFIF